jgi:hypothetical protein
MSQENVESVRSMCEAFLAGEFQRALSLLDADELCARRGRRADTVLYE